jgi:release factor glutamine methyltransferase
MAPTLQTIRENIKKELAGHYPDGEIDVLTGILISHRLDIRSHEIGLRRKEILGPADADWFAGAIDRLKMSYPVQYLTGETEFFGLKLKVGPQVLIPRPETEELVQWILEDRERGTGHPAAASEKVPVRILDAGTGSGCIALALASRLHDSIVTATDIHPPALDLASENARSLGLKVDFMELDILADPLAGWSTPGDPAGSGLQAAGGEAFDLIVSNPPYIPESERGSLDANVREFEPPSALFVPDADPLIFHRNLAGFAMRKLRKDGLLYLEIHEKSGEGVRQVLEQAGLCDIVLRKDLNGKDRMVRARLSSKDKPDRKP